MKKEGLRLRLALLAVFVLVPVSRAAAVDFVVSADVPPATGVSISATENHMEGSTEVFGPTVIAFDFNNASGHLDLDTVNGIYTSDHFFTIDVAAIGGAGSPNVTVSYGSESNPVGQTKGFGFKSTATFNKVTGGPAPSDQVDTTMGTHGTKLLNQISGGEFISNTDLLGGFLRIRVGVYDGANSALNTAGGEPFTNADISGPYSGVVTVTATL